MQKVHYVIFRDGITIAYKRAVDMGAAPQHSNHSNPGPNAGPEPILPLDVLPSFKSLCDPDILADARIYLDAWRENDPVFAPRAYAALQKECGRFAEIAQGIAAESDQSLDEIGTRLEPFREQLQRKVEVVMALSELKLEEAWRFLSSNSFPEPGDHPDYVTAYNSNILVVPDLLKLNMLLGRMWYDVVVLGTQLRAPHDSPD